VRMDEALQSSYRFCAALARREARNFYYAFLLLPKARRRSMCALYAFLRRTDDLADEPGSAPDKVRALHDWRLDLDAALAGRGTAWPGFPALADTIARHGIPAHLLHEVIEGVSTDVLPRRFLTFDELAGYCYQVAAVVGLCCLHIWGYRSQGGEAERLAEQCGIALQLTNIIRDVSDDARNGRIYLPRDDLVRFGVEPADLSAGGRPSDRVRALLTFEGKRAYLFYENAQRLAPLVAPVGRPVFLTIVGIYRALLDEIAFRDYNVLEARISLSPWRKLKITLRALAARSTAVDSRISPASGPQTERDAIAPPR
jgi:15-cis-phytoene synthase